MKNNWRERIKGIVEYSIQLLKEKNIIEDIGLIDYVAIFPNSENDYNELMDLLRQEGRPVKIVSTGTVFRLNRPIMTFLGRVWLIRIRIYQPNITQSGYVDYQIADYQEFRKRHLSIHSVAVTNNADGTEMLIVKNEKIIVYFPETPLGKNLESVI